MADHDTHDHTGVPGVGGSVATDTIWDAAGDLVQGTGANTAAKLGAGTAGHVLTSNGAAAAVSWQAPGGGSGALVLLEQHTASSSSSLDFTTFISSTYDHYQISGVDLVAQTSAAHLQLIIGTGGGPTYDTTVGNYEYALAAITTNAGSLSAGTSTTTLMRVFASMGNTSGWNNGFMLNAMGLQSTALRKMFHGSVWGVNSSPAAYIGVWGGNWLTTGTAVTALRFNMSSGNIASGTIRIYGVAK